MVIVTLLKNKKASLLISLLEKLHEPPGVCILYFEDCRLREHCILLKKKKRKDCLLHVFTQRDFFCFVFLLGDGMRGGRCSLGYAPFAEMVPITVILNSVTVFARMKMEGS